MAEYKELERSLLARMFRAGVIDAPTFHSRVVELGYNPDDVMLMIKLEQTEAVKTRLRGETFFSGFLMHDAGTQTKCSDSVSGVDEFTYLVLTIYIRSYSDTTYSTGLVFYDTAGVVVKEEWSSGKMGATPGVERSETITLTAPIPTGAVTVKVCVRCSQTTPATARIDYSMKSLDGVKV